MPNNPQEERCIQCGKTREYIKKNEDHCYTETNNENGREVDQEWPKHRFKPYSARELAAQKRDEDEICKQMGEMADFVKKLTGRL